MRTMRIMIEVEEHADGSIWMTRYPQGLPLGRASCRTQKVLKSMLDADEEKRRPKQAALTAQIRERNMEVWRLHQQGETGVKIAAKYNVTPQAISVIIRRGKRRTDSKYHIPGRNPFDPERFTADAPDYLKD